MGFPIKNPFSYSVRQKNKINKEIKAGTAADWFDKSRLRGLIKKHLAKEQNLTCCYCQKPKNSDHGRNWDLEHILPESIFGHFFFISRNHALACFECNTKKSAKIVVVDEFVDEARNGNFFPYHSEAYTIPHPHLEDPALYLKAIHTPRFESFEPIQPAGASAIEKTKGEKLIEVCELSDRSVGSAKVRDLAVKPEITAAIEAYSSAVKQHNDIEVGNQFEKILRMIADAKL